jgi:hypothetical protein
MSSSASRQIHLDFHTSELIPNVGTQFDKTQFQTALKEGNVNSITVFAKCHHSWCYFPTQVGSMHPALDFDLLGAQINAAHEIGVRAPIYITVGWSATDATKHPEWVVRNKEGGMIPRNVDLDATPDDRRPIVSWLYLCPGTAYGDHIFQLTEEICRRYSDLDGLFYDINFGPTCYCDDCRAGMKQQGLNPENETDAQTYGKQVWLAFAKRCTQILREYHPHATFFFNHGASIDDPAYHPLHTHFELEDLPTTWGGYDKLPLNAAYFRRYGLPYLGMTGKFHTTWGEFGGYKNPQALYYECALMLAMGARCSIGDQLHPNGKMDMETYRIIGHAYRYVEAIESWCYDEQSTATLGFLPSSNAHSNEGLVKILLESHIDFDILHENSDLKQYDCIILPDDVSVNETWQPRIQTYVDQHGALLCTGTSGMDRDTQRFVLNLGVSYVGPSRYEQDYLRVNSNWEGDMIESPLLCYEGAIQTNCTDGTILAQIYEPYFNRTYETYCSHQNAPYQDDPAPHPAAVQSGNVIFLAHPMCRMIYRDGAYFHRTYFLQALQRIYSTARVHIQVPSEARTRLTHQPNSNRYVFHVLYAPPTQRGRTLVIEDMPELREIPIFLRLDHPIKRVYLAPSSQEIPFQQDQNQITCTLPRLMGHSILVFDY